MEGQELVGFYYAIFKREYRFKVMKLQGRGAKAKAVTLEVPPTPDQQMEAAAWLADRGFGRAPFVLDTGEGEATGVAIIFRKGPNWDPLADQEPKSVAQGCGEVALPPRPPNQW